MYQKLLELVAYSNTRGSVNDKILYHVCCNTRLVKKSLADRIASTSGKKSCTHANNALVSSIYLFL